MGQGPFQALVGAVLGVLTPNKPLLVDVDGAVIIVPKAGATAQAVSIADGASVTVGAVADAAWSGTGSGTVVSVLKAIWTALTTAVTVQAKGGTYTNITTNASTNAIKTGAGVLQSVNVNTKGAAANVLTLFDSLTAAGTKIATIDTTAGPSTWNYNLAFATGLSALTATGTPADVTLVWR